MEQKEYRVLVWKPEGNLPLGRPRRRWEDNIKKDLQEVGCGDMDWIELAQDRDRLRALVNVQGGSNMTGIDLCVNKRHCAAAVRP